MKKYLLSIVICSSIRPEIITEHKYMYPQYSIYIDEASNIAGIEKIVIENIIRVESSGNQYAHNYYDARGLMGIVPRYHPECKNLYNPRDNILCGANYLKTLINGTGSVKDALRIYGGYKNKPEYESDKYVYKILRR